MDQEYMIYAAKVVSVYNITMITLYTVTMVMEPNQIITSKSLKSIESMTFFMFFFIIYWKNKSYDVSKFI